MEMEDHMERYKRSHDHRRDRHGRHSERTKRDIGAVRYSILEKRLNQNLGGSQAWIRENMGKSAYQT